MGSQAVGVTVNLKANNRRGQTTWLRLQGEIFIRDSLYPWVWTCVSKLAFREAGRNFSAANATACCRDYQHRE